MSGSPPTSRARARSSSQEKLLLGGILLLAAAAQLWFALGKGLVLDEFHTYFHATRPAWASFFEGLLADNHPPLGFLFIKSSVSLFGDSELAVRLPSMIFGLLGVVLLWRLVQEYGRGAAGYAAALLAASSLHLDFATQARMYSLHSLAVTGTCLALLRILSGAGKWKPRIALGVWLWVGAHNHYFFLHYAIGMGFAAFVVACLVPAYRESLKRLISPVALAVAFALPWFLFGFPQQWSHGLQPGGDDVGFLALLESYIHLFFLNVRLGSEVPFLGAVLREVYILSGVAIVVFGLLGAWIGMRPAQSDRVRAATLLMLSVGFFVPCWSAGWAWLVPRSGFTWHYVLPSAAALAWLTALALRETNSRTVKAMLGFALLAAASLSGLNAQGRGTEDYPGAVASILGQHEPGDLVISVEWQPGLFPEGLPWDYYAYRLASDPPARTGTLLNEASLEVQRLAEGARVFVLRTSLPLDQRLFKMLAANGLRVVGREPFGYGIEVLVYQ